jgi:mono/diheme cytochrome c family protein
VNASNTRPLAWSRALAEGARDCLLVGLSALAFAGCAGGSTTSSPERASSPSGLGNLAQRCDEPKSAMAAELDVALKALDIQGLHGSRGELTEGLNTLVAYSATREHGLDCGQLLAALVATFKQRARHTTFTERARGGLFSGGPTELAIEPPSAVALAGGAELAEFKLGRLVTAQSGCLACHRIGNNGNRGPGPDLTRVGSRLSPREIERGLISPQAPMPSFRRLPRAEFKAIVQFLALLRR